MDWRERMNKEFESIEREKRRKKQQNYESTQKVSKVFEDIKDTVLSFSTIIKWTKRAVGLLITVIGLFLTFHVVNFCSRVILWLVENWNWHVFFQVIIGIIAGAVLVTLIYLIVCWIELIKEKGLKLWYVKLVYWPCYYVIYLPIKIILWKFLIVTIIAGGCVLIWKSFISFLGIFGEYFGASYTDYCPGIEWKDEIYE
jgi:hypothetical protein